MQAIAVGLILAGVVCSVRAESLLVERRTEGVYSAFSITEEGIQHYQMERDVVVMWRQTGAGHTDVGRIRAAISSLPWRMLQPVYSAGKLDKELIVEQDEVAIHTLAPRSVHCTDRGSCPMAILEIVDRLEDISLRAAAPVTSSHRAVRALLPDWPTLSRTASWTEPRLGTLRTEAYRRAVRLPGRLIPAVTTTERAGEQQAVEVLTSGRKLYIERLPVNTTR